MDVYEATRVVLSRIQSVDLENAAKIVGLLLIRDHGEEEMIRLAFSSDALLCAVVAASRKELGLLLPPAAAVDDRKNTADSSVTAAPSNASASAFVLGRQNSSPRLHGGGGLASVGTSSPASWPPPLAFSRTGGRIVNEAVEYSQNSLEEFTSPSNAMVPHFYGAGAGCGNHLTDEFHLQEQPFFINSGASISAHGPRSETFYPEVTGNVKGTGAYPYSTAEWVSLQSRRCSAANEYVGPEATELGWKPCLYFARGYCKNGPSCRFLHGLPASGKMDNIAAAAADQQYEELLLRSKSQRQLVATSLPYSPTASLPESPLGPNKCMNFLLHQQYESQRAAANRMMRGNEGHKFLGQSGVMGRCDFAAAMSDPSSRQIYLTFPADCTFNEEDVSNYFSTYGPVQDVRIPYQQKRMFGFVTFVYPETVKLILAKGNPHFVSDARVLVKPYKEKGKVPAKCRRQQQEAEKSDIPGCVVPMGSDSRYPVGFSQLDERTRMSYSGDIGPEALLWRNLEEQQQAAELQHVIELRSQQFMGLQLLDLKTRNHFDFKSTNNMTIISPSVALATPEDDSCNAQKEDKNWNPAAVTTCEAATTMPQLTSQQHRVNFPASVNALEEYCADETTHKEDISIRESILEHNLPDSPFASSTKTSFFVGSSISSKFTNEENMISAVSTVNKGNNHHIRSGSVAFPLNPNLDIASFNQVFI